MGTTEGSEIVMPGVLVEIGGKQRRMVLDHRALMRLERITQKGAFAGSLDYRFLSNVVYLCWAALCRDYPDLDGFVSVDGRPDAQAEKGIDQVTQWLEEATQEDRVAKILEVIPALYAQTRPKVSEAEEKN